MRKYFDPSVHSRGVVVFICLVVFTLLLLGPNWLTNTLSVLVIAWFIGFVITYFFLAEEDD